MKRVRTRSGVLLCATLVMGQLAWAEPPPGDNADLARALEETNQRLTGVQQRLDALLRSGWEYRTVQYNLLANTREEVEQLGRDGWELVGVSEREGFVLKRRILPAAR